MSIVLALAIYVAYIIVSAIAIRTYIQFFIPGGFCHSTQSHQVVSLIYLGRQVVTFTLLHSQHIIKLKMHGNKLKTHVLLKCLHI